MENDGKKKKKIRNIKDGKIMVAEREGQDKTDTYYKRSRCLVKAAESLHVITGANVKAENVPTWPLGIRRQYVSAGFPLPEIGGGGGTTGWRKLPGSGCSNGRRIKSRQEDPGSSCFNRCSRDGGRGGG